MEQNEQVFLDADRLGESIGELPGPEARPTFIVVSGLPGTGKSYFAARLAERLGYVALESDALRLVLFPRPTHSPDESAYLFRTIHILIERLLKKGIPIILDATNLSERFREPLYSIAEHTGARLILVSVQAPPEVVWERLMTRLAASKSGSNADWSVYQRMKPTVERIVRNHFVVDTSQDITDALDRIVKEARK